MKITTKGDNLIIQLEGVERLWALKAGLNLKRDQIESIVWSQEKPRWRDIVAVRCPGTGVPKILYAGSFISNRGLEFWYLQMREPGFLVIKTSSGRYRNIRLTTTQGVSLNLKRWLAQDQKAKFKPVKIVKKAAKKTVKKIKKVTKPTSRKPRKAQA
jgi:hypothetical protein